MTACMESTDSVVNSSARKGSARFRSSFLQRVCHSAVNAHDKLGFSYCQPTVVGCTQQAVDRTRMLNMQEDAYCHRISAEVMKRCLYKPVAPCRRRIHNRAHNASPRLQMMQSLPVTPGQSNATTPVLSPTTSYSCFAVFSCGTTPRATSPETQDIDNQGLANLLTPRPRYVHASCSHISNNEPSSPESVFLAVPSISGQFYSRRAASIHCI